MSLDANSTTRASDPNGAPNWLCSWCRNMELSVESFIVRYPEPRGIPESSMLGSTKGLADGALRQRSGGLTKMSIIFSCVLRNIDECRLCKLIFDAVARYSKGTVRPEATLCLTWEVDGRQVKARHQHPNRTRRIHLSWHDEDDKKEDVHFIFVAPSESSIDTTFANDIRFLGRGLSNPIEKLDLIKGWLTICYKKHGKICHVSLNSVRELKRLAKSTYFGVIDVVDMNLKPLPVVNGTPEPYVALSYVWQKGSNHKFPDYTTTRSNVMVRIQPNGLKSAWDQIPKTIQDAVLLVKAIGERYLWIDSLCIVQDSKISWELNAQAMHLVYGNAHFTICAADGDCTTGLRAVHTTLRSGEPELPVNTMDESGHYVPLMAECLPGITLLVSRPPEVAVQDSIWNCRAWTFQERLLSRRCLIFAEGQVYYQCRSTVMSQDTFTDGGARGWSLDWTNSPLRTLGELRSRSFWFYMNCVRSYTGRDLTRGKDILAAFQGTSWLLKQYFNAPLFQGLPTSHFDLALLWAPLQALKRRKPDCSDHNNLDTCRQDANGNCNCIPRDNYEGSEFPSWSWCGWIGGKIAYQNDMIDGCLLNVQEWLRHHTWILWHVRDYKGNLLPLWDQSVMREDLSEEARWRGYKGRTQQVVSTVTRVSFGDGGERKVAGVGKFGDTNPYERASSGNPHGHMQQSATNIDQRNPRAEIRAARFLEQHAKPTWLRRSNAAYLRRLPAGYYGTSGPGKELDDPYTSQDDKISMVLRSPSPEARGQDLRLRNRFERKEPPRPASPPPPPPLEVIRPGGVKNGFEQPGPISDAHALNGAGSGSDADARSRDIGYCDSDFLGGTSESDKSFNGDAIRSTKFHEDSYGRLIKPIHRGSGTMFTGIVPDHPFGVARGPYCIREKDWLGALPVIQFWTWQTDLFVKISSEPSKAPNSLSSDNANGVADKDGQGLCQCDIIDRAGDWCGSIVLSRDWITDRQDMLHVFIAISDAKYFTDQECPVWNYYIPKEKEESEWDLYYVLLLERNVERATWERVALGKVFQVAFESSIWLEIKLS